MRNATTILGVMLSATLSTGAVAATPKPVSEMECLVGSWKGKASLTMEGKKVEGTVSWSCSRVSASYGVMCLGEFDFPGMVVIRETDLFGWDPASNRYHWFSVNDQGETHDHVAEAPAGPTIHFVYQGLHDGKPFREVIDMTLGKDSKSLTLRSENFVDGKSTLVFEASARKK
jgi:hypothetical protein